MRLAVASIVLLMPLYAQCVSLNPNDVPLFWTVFNQDPRYRDAAFKAQEAFLIQTGFTPFYNKLNSYVTDKANHVVTQTIDEYTPFSSKDVYFIMGTAYTLGIKKQISTSFHNPLWRPMRHTVSLGQDSCSVGINIPF